MKLRRALWSFVLLASAHIADSGATAQAPTLGNRLRNQRHGCTLTEMFGHRVVLHHRPFDLDHGAAACTRLANEGIDADLVELFDPCMVPLGAAMSGFQIQEPQFNLVVPRSDVARAHQILGW